MVTDIFTQPDQVVAALLEYPQVDGENQSIFFSSF